MSVNGPPKKTAEEAEVLLKQRIGSRVVGLHVLICEGGITLQGTARSYYYKQLAQHSAMRILGLPIVRNEIEVRLDRGPLDSYGLDLD